MTARKFLIFAPLLVSLLLLFSFFWVPTYEEQTKGNPDRLVQFVTASSGDAAMLNPILSADYGQQPDQRHGFRRTYRP
jgi:hypothetical protein